MWSCVRESKGDNIHQACANAVEMIMKTAISKRTLDNITVVMIGFSSFKYLLFPKRTELIGNNSVDNILDYNKLQEINRINNSFDVGYNDFSLEMGLSTQKYSAQFHTSIGNKQNPNKIIRKKGSNGSISASINGGNSIGSKAKNEKSQEKTNASGNQLNSKNILNGIGINTKLTTKKTENNLYSHRTVNKNNLEKKK